MLENLIKMDDLGVPLFSETPICFTESITDGLTADPFWLDDERRKVAFFVQRERVLVERVS